MCCEASANTVVLPNSLSGLQPLWWLSRRLCSILTRSKLFLRTVEGIYVPRYLSSKVKPFIYHFDYHRKACKVGRIPLSFAHLPAEVHLPKFTNRYRLAIITYLKAATVKLRVNIGV